MNTAPPRTALVGTALDRLLRTLRSASFRVSDEGELQRQVAELLDRDGIGYQREKILGVCKSSSRIDFWVHDHCGAGIGLELKVGQPAKQILRQLMRYADSPQICELVIASTSHSALRLPTEVLGKPLHSFQLRAWC